MAATGHRRNQGPTGAAFEVKSVFRERVVRRVGADLWIDSSGAPGAAVSQADRRGHLRGSRWPAGRALAGLRNIRTHHNHHRADVAESDLRHSGEER
jgi:hypothetical protein